MKTFCFIVICFISFDLFAKDMETPTESDSTSKAGAYNILYLDGGAILIPNSHI